MDHGQSWMKGFGKRLYWLTSLAMQVFSVCYHTTSFWTGRHSKHQPLEIAHELAWHPQGLHLPFKGWQRGKNKGLTTALQYPKWYLTASLMLMIPILTHGQISVRKWNTLESSSDPLGCRNVISTCLVLTNFQSAVVTDHSCITSMKLTKNKYCLLCVI